MEASLRVHVPEPRAGVFLLGPIITEAESAAFVDVFSDEWRHRPRRRRICFADGSAKAMGLDHILNNPSNDGSHDGRRKRTVGGPRTQSTTCAQDDATVGRLAAKLPPMSTSFPFSGCHAGDAGGSGGAGEVPELWRRTLSKLDRTVEDLLNTSAVELSRYAAYTQLMRYDKGGAGYGLHTDCNSDCVVGDRFLTLLVYLNTIESDTSHAGGGSNRSAGGETRFPKPRRGPAGEGGKLSIAPRAGHGILFRHLTKTDVMAEAVQKDAEEEEDARAHHPRKGEMRNEEGEGGGREVGGGEEGGDHHQAKDKKKIFRRTPRWRCDPRSVHESAPTRSTPKFVLQRFYHRKAFSSGDQVWTDDDGAQGFGMDDLDQTDWRFRIDQADAAFTQESGDAALIGLQREENAMKGGGGPGERHPGREVAGADKGTTGMKRGVPHGNKRRNARRRRNRRRQRRGEKQPPASTSLSATQPPPSVSGSDTPSPQSLGDTSWRGRDEMLVLCDSEHAWCVDKEFMWVGCGEMRFRLLGAALGGCRHRF